MSPDDQIYIGLLVLSIPVGYLFKLIATGPKTRACLSSIIGFAIVLTVCRYDVYHSLILIVSNAVLILFIHPNVTPILSFVWCFSYLLFFRTTEFFGVPKPLPYTNAVQLILTLKSVGLAFEVSDSFKRRIKLAELTKKQSIQENEQDQAIKQELEKVRLENEYASVRVGFLDILFYSYCYIGILTGPYFKYRTYHDWLHNSNKLNKVDSLKFLIKRGTTLPIIIVAFLLISRYVSFQDPLNDKFYEHSFSYRLVYMILIFTLFRARFYVAWILAEFSAITSVFGAYPISGKPKPGAGPTDLKELENFIKNNKDDDLTESVNFETVHNINEWGCETSPTVKNVMHHWNMTVQYWMASFVYKRVPFKKYGQPITMAVSAYWHGLHPGYYLSMLTTSPCILAEGLLEKGFKKRFLSPRLHKYYDTFTWFIRCRQFDYMSIGFILLSYEATVKFWSSVYFIGHLVCAVLVLIGLVLVKTAPRDKQNKKS